jgi:hypothetical protein
MPRRHAAEGGKDNPTGKLSSPHRKKQDRVAQSAPQKLKSAGHGDTIAQSPPGGLFAA